MRTMKNFLKNNYRQNMPQWLAEYNGNGIDLAAIRKTAEYILNCFWLGQIALRLGMAIRRQTLPESSAVCITSPGSSSADPAGDKQ